MRESVHLLAGRAQVKTLKEEIEEIVLDDGLARFICNSVKECLVNGIRHGRATAFFIELKKELSSVCLLISDNGSGTDGNIAEGFGLKGMRERAEKLGGKCSFSSEKDEGFETEIIIPLKGDTGDNI